MLPQEQLTSLDEEAAALREENARLREENSALHAQLAATQAQLAVLQAESDRLRQAPVPVEKPGRQPFRPDIEGLRGVAILLVVAFHIGLKQFGGGYIGVDVFFVLSGYLISGLIVREVRQKGRLDFKEFYARRVRRLVPGAALMLLVTLLVGAAIYAPLDIIAMGATFRAAALYFSNMHYASSALDYLGPYNDIDPLQHTWSLGVEEQFYLIWPLVLVGLLWLGTKARHPERVLVGGMALLTVASFVACIWLTLRVQPWAFFGMPTRVWEFGLGGLAALAPVAAGGRLLRNGLLAPVGLALVVGAGMVFNSETQMPGYLALFPAAGAALLLLAGATYPQGLATRLLGTLPLRLLGRYSYAWYLWHWPFIEYLRFARSSTLPQDAAVAALAALACAVVTTHLVEQPIRFNPALLRRPGLSLGLGVAVCVALGLVGTEARVYSAQQAATPAQKPFLFAQNDYQPDAKYGCLMALEQVAPDPKCVFGDSSSTKSVVLIGDSHSMQWFPTVDYVAKAKGWRLIGMGKAACPPHSIAQLYIWALHRIYDECATWRENALSEIGKLRPELVIMANIDGYSSPDTPIHTVTLDEWRAGLEKTVAAITAAGATAAIIADPPNSPFNIPACLAREHFALLAVRSCEFNNLVLTRSASQQVDRAVMDSLGPGHYIDLDEWICTTAKCSGERNGLVIYRDNNHMTATFAATLGPHLLDKINAIEPPLP